MALIHLTLTFLAIFHRFKRGDDDEKSKKKQLAL
jgi:hypothetical protein